MNYSDYDNLIQSLLSLNKEEKIGQQLYVLHGKHLTHAEYIYLRQNPNCSNLQELQVPSARLKQDMILDEFKNKYREQGLPEQDFFTPDQSIVVERLLRYVNIPLHKHQFIEFAYVVTGTCVHRLNGEDFTQEAGSFVSIANTIPHVLFPSDDCLCLTIKIKSDTFQKMEFPDIVRFIYPLVFDCAGDTFVRNIILSIYDQQENNRTNGTQLIEHLFQVLILYILQRYQKQGQILSSRSNKDTRILEILNYAVNNYQTITLHNIASHFHYNDSYFSRMFHQQTGLTFSTTLREYRLNKAASLLRDSNMTLEDICNKIGYKDITQFIRNFKVIYQTTPAKYRKNND